MASNASIRKRCRNWIREEKEYLLDSIREYVDVIEDRKTNAGINRKKAVAWGKVQSLFATKFGVESRSLKQLKEQWKYMKLISKRTISAYEKLRAKTGGGPPPTPPTSIDLEIKDMIPSEFRQLNNPFDDDSQYDARIDDTEKENK